MKGVTSVNLLCSFWRILELVLVDVLDDIVSRFVFVSPTNDSYRTRRVSARVPSDACTDPSLGDTLTAL